MKQAYSFIAPQEQAALKKWWSITLLLSATFLGITMYCTHRIYSIIHEKELSLQAISSQKSVPNIPQKPFATDIIATIIAQLPGSVAFTTLDLEPNFLAITGKTQDQYAWASWIEDMQTIAWISSVQVEYLQKIPSQLHEYSFSIRLCF